MNKFRFFYVKSCGKNSKFSLGGIRSKILNARVQFIAIDTL